MLPAGHELTHDEPEQYVPVPQAWPQDPQSVLVVILRSQPLEARPSQSAQPALHVPTVQAPAVHAATALARLHALPQAPQLAGDVLVSTSHPSTGFKLQSA